MMCRSLLCFPPYFILQKPKNTHIVYKGIFLNVGMCRQSLTEQPGSPAEIFISLWVGRSFSSKARDIQYLLLTTQLLMQYGALM